MDANWIEAASGLQFPEGPIAMADGSVLVVEIAAGRLLKTEWARPGLALHHQ